VRRHGAHFSTAVQLGLALSVAVAIGVGVTQAWGERSSGPPLDSTLRDLRARAAELTTIIDERRADRLTDAFVQSHVARWERVTRDVSRELVRASDVDATGLAARGQRIAVALVSIGGRVRERASIDASTRDAAAQAATEAAALVVQGTQRSAR
jgi:hypothetical protein